MVGPIVAIFGIVTVKAAKLEIGIAGKLHLLIAEEILTAIQDGRAIEYINVSSLMHAFFC